MSVFFSSLLMFLFLLKWISSSRKSLFYFLCHCHSWISLNNCLLWFDHESRRFFRRLKLWWFSTIVIKKMLKKKFDFRNWLCFFWISWHIWSRVCAVNLIERIEFFDAELLRAFMLDLIIFFDCVYVRRWDWWLFVIVHRKWIRRAVVELRINEVQFLMLCLKWIWILSLWFVSFAFVCLLKIWLFFFFLLKIMFFCENVSYRCAINELRKNDS